MIGPFVFLDIDGVLNGHGKHPNRYCGVGESSVAVLNHVLEATSASCVLVSAWRYFILRGEMTVRGFDGMMCTHGLKRNAIVSHVGPDEPHGSRGKLIQKWFLDNFGSAHQCPYIIFDDMDLGYTALDMPLFQTDGALGLDGLSGAKIGKAIQTLKQEF